MEEDTVFYLSVLSIYSIYLCGINDTVVVQQVLLSL